MIRRVTLVVVTLALLTAGSARAARSIMKMADKTDIKAGTLSPQDRGDPAAERHSPFNPMRTVPGGSAAAFGAPGWVYGGFVIARSLEFSAREKGVRFMLNRHMDELIREQPFSGRVLGIKAGYTPRMPDQTPRMTVLADENQPPVPFTHASLAFSTWRPCASPRS